MCVCGLFGDFYYSIAWHMKWPMIIQARTTIAHVNTHHIYNFALLWLKFNSCGVIRPLFSTTVTLRFVSIRFFILCFLYSNHFLRIEWKISILVRVHTAEMVHEIGKQNPKLKYQMEMAIYWGTVQLNQCNTFECTPVSASAILHKSKEVWLRNSVHMFTHSINLIESYFTFVY